MLSLSAVILGMNVLFIVPAVLLFRHAEELRGRRHNCRYCGYDVRANPLICAECGGPEPLRGTETLERRFQACQALAAILVAIPLTADCLFVLPLAGLLLERFAAN